MILRARKHTVTFPRPPLVMGIVNLSADSFSGDGLADPGAALEHARTLVEQGAEIIDIGAESARTNRAPISEAEEAAQLLAFLRLWKGSGLGERTLLSINTWRPAVVREVLPEGGDLLNDIGALPTAGNAATCATHGVALLIMHSVGEPKVPHTHVAWDDIMVRLDAFFTEKIAMAERAGVAPECIVLDPGIDFAKQREDNLTIYRELQRLHRFGRPVLLPVSRKTVIGEVLGLPQAAERDAGTVACVVRAVTKGAHIVRVHNVRAAVEAIRTAVAVESAGRPEPATRPVL